MKHGRFLGAWRTKDGNSVVVRLAAGLPAPDLDLRWQREPLSDDDLREYLDRILPEIELCAREYFEIVGPVLMVLGG